MSSRLLLAGALLLGGVLGSAAPASPAARSSAWGQAALTVSRVAAATRERGRALERGDSVVVEVDGRETVARVHAVVPGSTYLMLPDGQIGRVASSELPVSDRPFEPYSVEALADRIRDLAGVPEFDVHLPRRGRRYLYVYDCSEEFRQLCETVLESEYRGILSFLRRRVRGPLARRLQEPEFPLVVVICRDREQFQAYREMPEGVVAYYDATTNRVVMYEHREAGAIAGNAVATIAHEGVHQVLHNIGVQERLALWPRWLSEGLAEYFSPVSMQPGAMEWLGVGVPNPLHLRSLAADPLVQGIGGGRAQARGNRAGFIATVLESPQLSAQEYSRAWALVHFLIERRRAQFYEYLEVVSRLEPLEETAIETELERFNEAFGEDWERLEVELVRHLGMLDARGG